MKTAAALTTILALGLSACGGSSEPTSSAPATAPVAGTETASTGGAGGAGGEYPAAARESFLDSCEAGGSAEQCECALEYLEQNVPIEEFVQAGVDVSEGAEPPAFIQDAEKNCA